MSDRTVYRSSTGEYVGEAEVWERLESGVWAPCCWDAETGREWIETQHGDLLLLIPVSRHALPDRVDANCDADGVRTRERVPTE